MFRQQTKFLQRFFSDTSRTNKNLVSLTVPPDRTPDDYVFLRPNQSEAVFLQFGDIALFDGEKITGVWPTFPVSA